MVDVSMFESLVGMLLGEVNRAFFDFEMPSRPMYGPVEAKDGYVMLATASEKTFQDMATAAGRRDWLTDPRFEKYADRRMNWDKFVDEFESWSKKLTVNECVAALEKHGVPCSPYVTVTEDQALAQAKAADQARAAGMAGHYAGIPFAHKDIFCTRGWRTTCGSRMLENFVSPYDATVTEKLRQAGALWAPYQTFRELAQDRDGFNPVYMMAVSGARGSREQIKQLSGMRGLMSKPQKKITGHEIIENPILSCFREGLNVLEYFISTHGARKGLADTALKTADAGYLTRRLVDVAQDLVINEEDCGTVLGLEMRDTTEGDDVVVPVQEKILGRVACDDIYHPIKDELLCNAGQLIDEVTAERLGHAGLESIRVRSVLTCEAVRGVCGKCYGRNLANGRMIDVGEAVGVMAAQSIGEPGTQLTLRTFHIGGAASRMTAESHKKSKWECSVSLIDVETVSSRKGEKVVTSRSGEMALIDDSGMTKVRYVVPYGSVLKVSDGQKVKTGTLLFDWDPYNTLIISRNSGKIEFDGLKDGVTFVTEFDDATGMEQLRVIRDKRARLHPHMNVIDAAGNKLGRYSIPENAYLQFRHGDEVSAGDALVKIARAAGKTRDITGGLPRVAELFEARRPKSPSVVTAIDGIVEFGEVERGQQRIIVGDNEVKESYLIPRGKHVTVHPGDRVRSGDKLCDGPVDPHDILRISGDAEVQRYLVEEIQAVYRLQGVTISDKHIECIVRQMMRKVVIENPGDTELLEGEEISKARLREENNRIGAKNGAAATFRPLLLGITKASLATDSFISAASFQETTKVLTHAAIAGKMDTLEGLKENVIMGHLIPSGTGNMRVNDVRVKDLDAEAEEAAAAHAAAQELAGETSGMEALFSQETAG